MLSWQDAFLTEICWPTLCYLMHNEDENRSIGYKISWIHFHTLLAVWSNLCMFCRLLIRLKMPSTIFWRRNVYGDNTIYTPLTLHCYLAWLTTCTANFLFLSSKFGIIVGCRLISYSFYLQIHGGDIRPHFFANIFVGWRG